MQGQGGAEEDGADAAEVGAVGDGRGGDAQLAAGQAVAVAGDGRKEGVVGGGFHLVGGDGAGGLVGGSQGEGAVFFAAQQVGGGQLDAEVGLDDDHRIDDHEGDGADALAEGVVEVAEGDAAGEALADGYPELEAADEAGAGGGGLGGEAVALQAEAGVEGHLLVEQAGAAPEAQLFGIVEEGQGTEGAVAGPQPLEAQPELGEVGVEADAEVIGLAVGRGAAGPEQAQHAAVEAGAGVAEAGGGAVAGKGAVGEVESHVEAGAELLFALEFEDEVFLGAQAGAVGQGEGGCVVAGVEQDGGELALAVVEGDFHAAAHAPVDGVEVLDGAGFGGALAAQAAAHGADVKVAGPQLEADAFEVVSVEGVGREVEGAVAEVQLQPLVGGAEAVEGVGGQSVGGIAVGKSHGEGALKAEQIDEEAGVEAGGEGVGALGDAGELVPAQAGLQAAAHAQVVAGGEAILDGGPEAVDVLSGSGSEDGGNKQAGEQAFGESRFRHNNKVTV